MPKYNAEVHTWICKEVTSSSLIWTVERNYYFLINFKLTTGKIQGHYSLQHEENVRKTNHF